MDNAPKIMGHGSQYEGAKKWHYYTPPQISKQDILKFRRIVKTFSKATATAHDKLPPRIMDSLDDDTIKELTELLLLYKRAEQEERWPELCST